VELVWAEEKGVCSNGQKVWVLTGTLSCRPVHLNLEVIILTVGLWRHLWLNEDVEQQP
jgi:hypothetical protein